MLGARCGSVARRLPVWFFLLCVVHMFFTGFLQVSLSKETKTHTSGWWENLNCPSERANLQPSTPSYIILLVWLAAGGRDTRTWCLLHTNKRSSVVRYARSISAPRWPSHDWSRVWNSSSNIHESRPALHHLCATSRAPGMRTRSRGRAIALRQWREAEQRKKLRKW